MEKAFLWCHCLFVCYLFGIRHVQKIKIYKLANTTSYKTPKSQNAGITHKFWLHMQTYFQWGPEQKELKSAKTQKKKDKAKIFLGKREKQSLSVILSF